MANKKNKSLLFIDTNILLDFYRLRTESGLKLLSPLDTLHEKLITSYQVEMEFKKNRQTVIRESLKNLKLPDKVPHAAFLAETQSASKLDKIISDADKRVKGMRKRLENILAKPTTHDPVYKVVQRLFMNGSSLNLDRKNPVRRSIKRASFRRYILGYPPRKKADTSMGDAFNWEWIIAVAKETACHVVIVSRDSDFGIEIDGNAYINDWLIQEFRDRVAKTRQLTLCTRLSAALKMIDHPVSQTTADEEEEIVSGASKMGATAMPWEGMKSDFAAAFAEIIRALPKSKGDG